MTRTLAQCCWFFSLLLFASGTDLYAQKPPYDVFPPAEPPYYRVRYEASTRPGELVFAVNYTVWIPKDVKTLRGVVVHQHGCGEGSCKSGLTGAFDLHWQALAKKHDCALLSPSYEQPEKADCQLWCDPRNGSDAAFQKCLADLGAKSGHPELARVPWALWGHSGGGHWAGGMVLLHPDRVAAAWLRSGVPLLKPDPKRAEIKAHALPDAVLKVPVMCNLGTKEGVTVKGDRFAGVWPANQAFFNEVRGKGGLIGVAVDPLASHECGNQRYLAIPWLDACLGARLPKVVGDPLRAMPTDAAWLAPILGGEAVPAGKYASDPLKAAWLPNEAIAKAWVEYVKDTKVADATPPPGPTNLRVRGNRLTWEAEADLESGLGGFLIECDGQFLANVPEEGKNPFGRPVFQGLQYSDTPTQPLVPMQFMDTKAEPGKKHTYRVLAVNTVGLKSKPSAEAAAAEQPSAVPVGRVEDTPAYRVLAQDRGRVAVVNARGEVEWEVPCPFGSHDIARLANGNFLLHTGAATVVEMTSSKKVVWKYEARPKEGYRGAVEVHAFQRLDDGNTLVAESGNRRLVEVDRDGKVVREVPLTVDRPDPHRDTRLARKLDNGHYLVCHEGDGKVREYDDKGNVVWTYALDLGGRPRSPGHGPEGHGIEVFGALRLAGGNTLIAGGNNNRVLEVTPEGKTVWSIGHDELPSIRLAWVTTLQVLPSGNLIVGNCHAGPDNPQLFEVTRDKKVVWTFKDFKTFGNSTAAAQVLDVRGKVLR
jgi:hypothetical protein